MITPEGAVKTAIKRYLLGLGAYYHMPVLNGYGETTLDFTVCYKGRFIGIEAKRGDGVKSNPTPRQVFVMERITAAGGLAFVARSVKDVEDMFRMEGLL